MSCAQRERVFLLKILKIKIMKKISLLIVLMASLYSCKKSDNAGSENGVQGNAISSSSAAERKKGGLCVENNVNTLTNSNGEWSCPSPAKDCGKISPCGAISGGGSGGIDVDKLHVDDLSDLETAIDNGTLKEYIATPEGDKFFRNLLGKKNQLLSLLISGDLTVVKKMSNATGNAFFLVIKQGADADKIRAEEVFASYEYSVK